MTKEVYNQSILRASNIIDLFTQQRDKWSMKDLALACKMPTTTIIPLLKALEMTGYLERDEDTKLYRLGIKFVKKSQLVTMGLDLREQARPVLRNLSFKFNLNTHLAVMDNGEVIYIDRCEAVVNSLVPSYIGKRVPAHCTSLGKAMLAYMDPADIERIIDVNNLSKHTQTTVTEWPELLKQFEEIRIRQYSVDDGEYQADGYCIGVPIFDSENKVIAAISIAVAKTSENMRDIDRIIKAICEAGKTISDKMV